MGTLTRMQTMFYNDKIDTEQQVEMEERIAYTLFNRSELSEEDCAVLGKEILLNVLAEFRPDLMADALPRTDSERIQDAVSLLEGLDEELPLTVAGHPVRLNHITYALARYAEELEDTPDLDEWKEPDLLPRSEMNTDVVCNEVEYAFDEFLTRKGIAAGSYTVFFDRGRWWCNARPSVGASRTFSVQDATGGDSIHGFLFKEI